MSDTPRTDAAYFSKATLYDLAGEMKKLQRELTAAQAEIARLTRERDEARAEKDAALDLVMATDAAGKYMLEIKGSKAGHPIVPTPRTDAEFEYDATTIDDVQNFARKLERALAVAINERNEARAVLMDPQALWINICRGAVTLPKGIGDVRQWQDRVQQLESDWSGWTDLQRERFGDKYAAMQPLEAVRARIEDTEARIKRLEKAGDDLWEAIEFDGCTIALRARLANSWKKAKEAQ